MFYEIPSQYTSTILELQIMILIFTYRKHTKLLEKHNVGRQLSVY